MPQPASARVLAKIRRLWPDADPTEVLDILAGYGADGQAWGRERVYLAILKLSEGQIQRLPSLVAMANTDYRDVVAYAECPEEMHLGAAVTRELSVAARRAVRQRDRRQYERWLRSLGSG